MKKPIIISPNRPKPTYAEACRGKYAFPLPYEICEIKFWKNNAKNYEKACFLCSLFPEHKLNMGAAPPFNSILIRTEGEFHKYYPALYELYKIISHWKYVEFYIGETVCYPNEFWLYMNTTNTYSELKSPMIDVKSELKSFDSGWLKEKQLYNIIKTLFGVGNVVFHYRAPWLERLELDIYISKIKVGIEYQGIQHFKIVKHWGGKDGFEKRRLNDIRKKMLCEQYGISLIYFYYYENITEELVIERLFPYL